MKNSKSHTLYPYSIEQKENCLIICRSIALFTNNTVGIGERIYLHCLHQRPFQYEKLTLGFDFWHLAI